MAAKILTGILVVAALWLLANIFTTAWQSRFIFRTSRLPANHVFRFAVPFEEVWLDRPEGVRLHGLWFRAPGSRGLILYFHGNKGHVGRWGHLHWQFRRWGYDLMLFDYRGYGRSTGRLHGHAREADLLDDALAMYDRAAAHYAPERIVVFGRSMGTAFATRVARERPVRGLVLEAPFRSMPELFRSWWKLPPALFRFRFRFDNEARLPAVQAPVLIVHGTADELVPFSHGAFLASAKKGTTFVPVPEGGHHHLWFFDRYQEAVRDFLEEIHEP